MGVLILIGASCLEEHQNEDEWTLQIIKQRSFFEKILGQEKILKEDECFLYFKKIIESEPNFKNIEFE